MLPLTPSRSTEDLFAKNANQDLFHIYLDGNLIFAASCFVGEDLICCVLMLWLPGDDHDGVCDPDS